MENIVAIQQYKYQVYIRIAIKMSRKEEEKKHVESAKSSYEQKQSVKKKKTQKESYDMHQNQAEWNPWIMMMREGDHDT